MIASNISKTLLPNQKSHWKQRVQSLFLSTFLVTLFSALSPSFHSRCMSKSRVWPSFFFLFLFLFISLPNLSKTSISCVSSPHGGILEHSVLFVVDLTALPGRHKGCILKLYLPHKLLSQWHLIYQAVSLFDKETNKGEEFLSLHFLLKTHV